MNFDELISGLAGASPEAMILTAPGTPGLTGRRLHELDQLTARSLAALGVGRGDRVALVCPDGPEMAAAFLAIGASVTVAPLNAAYKKPEFVFFLDDLKPALLVTLRSFDTPAVAVAEEMGVPIAYLDPEHEAGWFNLSCDGDLPETGIPPAGDDDVAMVLHTSGTTARPKIVPLTHANLLASAGNVAATLELDESDRCLSVMPLFHIHGLVGVLLSTVRSGGTVVCTPGFSADLFLGWLRDVGPTWYSAVPTMHQAVLGRLADEGKNALAGVPLRFVRSSSAPMPPAVIRRLEEELEVPVIEAYGMTEASHQITSNPLPPGERKPGSVGKAPDGRVRIDGSGAEHAAVGEAGEVLIRGENVTHGYDDNEAANLEAFDQGWFRTGDLGYLDADRYLFLTGRIKEIINRGGEKVSPREVDDVLSDHPSIKQVVTFAIPHESLGEDIAAAIVLREGAKFDQRDIRNFAFDRLAGFKVPSHIVVLEEIPKGPTGKLQRIGLAEKLARRLETPYEAPESGTEASLALIWEEVLQTTGIGAHDNFFLRGGDSIRATMVAARIRERMGADVPLPLIFREPTLRGQAEAVLNAQLEALPPEVLAQYLAELDGMTDDEAEARMAGDSDGG